MTRARLRLDALETRLTPATIVTNVQFGDGTAQRSMITEIVVSFSDPVTFTGPAASAFTVSRSAASAMPGALGNVTLIANPSSGPTSSVRLTFPQSSSLTTHYSLIDGIYDFMINAAEVNGPNGALDGNEDGIPGGSYSDKFYRIFGDADGSGSTHLADISMFPSLQNPTYIFAFDYDNSGPPGPMGLSDFARFRARYNLQP